MMTFPEDVMKLAREAAAAEIRLSTSPNGVLAGLVAEGKCDHMRVVGSAARAITAERERCAKVVESVIPDGRPLSRQRLAHRAGHTAAAAIRSGAAP